ncbi:hypothetical protein OAK98_05905, partial [Mariniblastus sp.]|nr:hypothetical protein [Mariniblastus sp.]
MQDNNAMNRSGEASAVGESRQQFAEGLLLYIAPTFEGQRHSSARLSWTLCRFTMICQNCNQN